MTTNIIKQSELIWLAGLLEGDGSFYASFEKAPIFEVGLMSVDKDVISKASRIVGAKYYKLLSKKANHKDIYSLRVRGNRAVELSELLLPFMGLRRRKKISENLEMFAQWKIDCVEKKSKFLNKDNSELKRLMEQDYKSMSYREIGKKYGCSHEKVRTVLFGDKRVKVSKNSNDIRQIFSLELTKNLDTETQWLYGILEAEGSFLPGVPSRPNAPIISIQMTDKDVMQKVAYLLGCKLQSFQRKGFNKSGNPYKLAYMCIVKGKRSVSFMEKFKPYMGVRRQEQINKSLSSYDPLARKKYHEATRKLSDAQCKEAIELRNMGKTIQSIADKFSVNKDTIRYGFKRMMEM